jgi:hypothetical protein
MKTTELIRILQMAQLEYGDVPVQLMNPETGDWKIVQSVIKLYPYTGPHGCMNRTQPVNALAITYFRNNADDLVLGMAQRRRCGASRERSLAEG